MLKKLTALLVAAVLLIGAAAIPVTEAQVQTSDPRVNIGTLRVVNALVGLGDVDVFLDGERIVYGLSPEQATPYLYIPAGDHNLTVRPVDADELSLPIADVLIDLAPNGSQTAIVYQRLFASEQDSYEQSGAIYVINDDRSPIQLGKTRLTAVHLAVGTPQNVTIGYPSGEALLYNLGLEKPYGTVDIDAGSYPLTVIDATSSNLAILQRYGDANLYANTLYTLIVVPNMTPLVGQPAYTLQAVAPEPRLIVISGPLDPPEGNGIRLRIVHAAHDTSVLNLYIDERLVASRVNYGRVTEYLGLANYGHTITIRRFGDAPDAPPLGRAVFTITADNSSQTTWTLLLVNSNPSNTAALQANAANPEPNAPVVFNTPGGDVMIALLPDNISSTQRDSSRVRVINAADGVPGLRLFTKAYPAIKLPDGVTATPAPPPTPGPLPPPSQVTEGVLFGAEANEAEIPSGFYEQLTFVPVGGSDAVDTINDIQLVGGVVYTFILIGAPTGDPPLDLIRLEDYGTGLPVERQYVGTITATSARVRAAPSTQAAQVAALTRDFQVTVLGRNTTAEWVRIRFNNPQTGVRQEGWISATILRVTRLGVPITNLGSLPEYVGP